MIFTADPRSGYLSLKDEIDTAISMVLAQTDYILGPVVDQFEAAFADYLGATHGVGVNSGTDALHLALRGLGIGKGDEVITVSHTSVATIAAIEMTGAAPVLVDVEPLWRTINPAAAECAISPRTKAILAVHLYGQPADIGALRSICDRRSLALVEDCAQSHGAKWEGEFTGTFGAAACFSFYPTKNLGTVGDGGMVVTSDDVLAGRVRMLRQYGWDRPQHSVVPGWNSRLGPMQAAILNVKLRYLEGMTERRRGIAARYHDAFDDLPLHRPVERPGSRHAWHLYVVRMEDAAVRDRLMAHLLSHGIAGGIHYPLPVHLQPAYAGRIAAYDLKITESLCRSVLSLPLYPELDYSRQSRVIDAVRSFFLGSR
jgi:dTDP-4-amino-4,6-dideoxygalactose transaminase